MATYAVTIEGVSRALQHGFTDKAQQQLDQGPVINIVGVVYEGEWMITCHVTDEGEVYWPANYVWAAMKKNASAFKIPGKRGKTFKDAVTAYVVVEGLQDPDQLRTGLTLQNDLDGNPLSALYVDRQPVVISRSRVMRERLGLNQGWKTSFTLETLEPIPPDILRNILELAGKSGIGDYRPRYGRFRVVEWAEAEDAKA